MKKHGKSTKPVASETKPPAVPQVQKMSDEEKPKGPPVKKDLSALIRERDLLLSKLYERNEQLSELKQRRIATEESCVLHWELLQDMEVALEEKRRLRQRREKELQQCKRLVKAKAQKVKQDLEEQASFKHQLCRKLQLEMTLGNQLESQVEELSEEMTTLQASVQPVECAGQTQGLLEESVPQPERSETVTKDASLDVTVSDPQAVPEPSKKRKKRKNKKRKKIPAPEELETGDSVSAPLADQRTPENISLDQIKTEETDSPAAESFPQETVTESRENVAEEAPVQVQVSDTVFASEQPVTAEPSRKRRRPMEMDTTESPPIKKPRICKPVLVRTRLAKRRSAVKPKLEDTTDKSALGLPWTFISENDPETEESVVSELLREETDGSSQPEPPKKEKVSLWRRFKKALTPARWRKYKSDTPVVIPDQRLTDTAEAVEHLLQSTSVDDQDSDSLTSQSTDSGLTEEGTSDEEETSDDEDEISDEEEETSDDEEEISDEEETSDDQKERSDEEEEESPDGQRISVWRRFKKALTPASKRQYKNRLEI